MVIISLFYSNVCSEEYPAIREEDALSKWVSDPANTAWMESKFSSFHFPMRNMSFYTMICLFSFSISICIYLVYTFCLEHNRTGIVKF